tara:strand:- start:476 stop:745 length:270 start_codon:yes stop_codon:yes gene_type:complete
MESKTSMTKTKIDTKAKIIKADEPSKSTSNIFAMAEDNPDTRVTYDLAELKDFMDMVFAGADPSDEHENTLCWATDRNIPGFPAVRTIY